MDWKGNWFVPQTICFAYQVLDLPMTSELEFFLNWAQLTPTYANRKLRTLGHTIFFQLLGTEQ